MEHQRELCIFLENKYVGRARICYTDDIEMVPAEIRTPYFRDSE